MTARIAHVCLLLIVAAANVAADEDRLTELRQAAPREAFYVSSLGTFRYQSASTQADDGLTVVCPERNSQSFTTTIRGNGEQQLPHRGLLLGSVQFQFAAGDARNYTDWDLHGHSWAVRGNNPPLIDHGAGRTTPVFPADECNVTYRYAAKPGRWLRVWSASEPVTPSMLGAVGQGDESNRLAWTLTLAHRVGRDVFIDREYFYSQVLEIQPAQRVYGRGSDFPGLTLLAGAVFERMRTDGDNIQPRWAQATALQRALQCSPPMITHRPDCKSLTLERLQLNGNQQQVDWRAVEQSRGFDRDGVSNLLRNSPACAALSFMSQNNRPCDGLRVTLHDVHAHDYPSSCIVMDPAVRCTTRDVRAGNSVSGRVIYYFSGHHTNLQTYGYSRTSIARLCTPFVCDGFTYRGGGWKNPWPENTVPEVVLAPTNATNVDVRHGNHPQPFSVRGLDIDCTDSPFTTAVSIGVDCDLEGVVRGGRVKTRSAASGAMNGVRIKLVTENSRPPVLAFPTRQAMANWNDLRYTQIDNRTDRPVAIDNWEYTAASFQQWSRLLHPATVVRVKRTEAHAADFAQSLRLTLDFDWPSSGLLHIPDLAGLRPEECVPTRIWIEGGRFDNRLARLISVNEGFESDNWPDNLQEYPVRVYCDGVRFNMIAPQGFAGDNSYPRQFALLKLRNCETPDGLRSEESGTLTIAAGQSEADVATRLMWKPLNTQISGPVAVDYEWLVKDAGEKIEDARRPILRIKIPRQKSAVTLQWSAQVSPW